MIERFIDNPELYGLAVLGLLLALERSLAALAGTFKALARVAVWATPNDDRDEKLLTSVARTLESASELAGRISRWASVLVGRKPGK